MSDRPREPAICLYVIDFSETSQVAHLLGRDSGVVHLLAKGSKRPKSASGGRLDLLEEGELVFIPTRAEGLGTLVEFSPSTHHMAVRRRRDALDAALYMLEVTRMLLAEADPHPAAFDLLSAALTRLEKPDAPTQAVLAFFQWRLLRQVGLLGEMDACVSCGRPAESRVVFSSRQGGFLCGQCRGAAEESRAVAAPALAGVAALRAMDRRRPATLAEDQAAAVNELLAYHLSYQLGKSPRMLRHVRPRRRAAPARPAGQPPGAQKKPPAGPAVTGG